MNPASSGEGTGVPAGALPPLYTLMDRWMIATLLAGVLALAVWLWAVWSSLPELVPTHFGFDGDPDVWGRRRALFSLPGMALLQALCAVGIGTLLGTVARRSFDTDPTRSRAYAALKTAVLACSLGEVVLFAWIQGRTIDIALGAARGLGQAFAWVVFSVAGLAVLCVLLILARLRRPSGLAASRRDPPDGP